MDIDREEVMQVFAEESKEHLETLEQVLLTIEADPKDPERLHALFRAAHSLKGNAGIVQLTQVAAAAHTLEDVLDRVKRGLMPVSTELVSLLLRAVDGLRRVIPLAIEGVDAPQPEHAALAAWLLTQGAPVAAGPAQKTPAPQALPPAPPVEHDAPAAPGTERSLRVDVQKLDRMLDLVGEITIARGRLGSLLAAGASSSLEELRDAHQGAERLYLELQEQLMRSRMVPLGPTFRRYQRVVRDLALSRGKSVRLVLDGEDVEVDTAVVERIRDPLTHMIRNAVDHGLEDAATRSACGKDPTGTITLCARHESSSIVISVSDDGQGLDRQKILERGKALKLVAEGESLTEQGLLQLIFRPGFSTADAVTELSGRGMGMSVVEKSIEALRGQVLVSSEPKKGTAITMRLPLTLAIIEGFSVAVGPEIFVVPLESVVECIALPAAERTGERAQGVIELRGEPLPFVRLAKLFDLPKDAEARESVVVLEHGGLRAGVAVDALLGAGQTVIKPLAPLVDHAPTAAGCALLGSGRVALILDVPALFEAAIAEGARATSARAPEPPAAPAEVGP